MSDCEDDDHDSEDKTDALAERVIEESMSWESDPDCNDDESAKSYWKLATVSNLMEGCYGYNDDGENDDDENKINDGRFLDVLSHFVDVPESLTACDDNEAYPGSVEFQIYHGSFCDKSDYKFDDPLPDDDDGSDGGGMVGKLVTIGGVAGSAAGGVYAVAGAGLVIGYIVASSIDSDPIDYEKTENNSSQTCYWDINAAGSSESDFPSDPCESAGVQIFINTLVTGEFKVNASSRWTFTYRKPTDGTNDYNDDTCCDDAPRTYLKTTIWVNNQFDIESVDGCDNEE
jgi:hypothetical protein